MSDRTPEQIVADLAPAYTEWKKGEKDKNKLKDEFFEAITVWNRDNKEQAEDLLYVKADDPEAAQEYALKKRPGWLIEDWREHPTDAGAYEVIVHEDPAFQSFTIEYDDKVWGRQVTSGPTFIDDERLLLDNPELWFEITEFPNEDFLFALFEEDEEATNQEKLEHFELIGQKFDIHRRLKSLTDLQPETLAKLQPYLFEGKPSLKLPAPKKLTT